ncbi:family 16 glycoside hydrolase [Spirosoma rhododendri]|uniref:family 16 glycoside hydrolase n=1 Tax=Spirosoma rhododendri TaxID=2728024 RepID=UPI002FCD7FFF
MKHTLFFLFILTVVSTAQAQKGATDNDWLYLFNGKDLTGWDAKVAGYPLDDNVGNAFRAENGMLRIVYDQPAYNRFDGKYGHLYYKKPFSHYILRFDYRFQGEQVPGAIAGTCATVAS